MGRAFWLVGIFTVILIFLFGVAFIYSPKNSERGINERVLKTEDTGNLESEDNLISGEAIYEGTGRSSGGSSGGGGSSGSGGISEPGSESEEVNEENYCVLIRPGNLPHITCFVNYIKNESVSLKIRNQLGESMSVKMKLGECIPEVQKTIENDEEENFVFECDNFGKEEFYEDVFVTYVLEGEIKVEIGGIVGGIVSN